MITMRNQINPSSKVSKVALSKIAQKGKLYDQQWGTSKPLWSTKRTPDRAYAKKRK